MAYRKVDESSLTTVADAIRAKGGTSGALAFPEGFAAAIGAIQTGGDPVLLQSKSVTPTEDPQTVTPDSGYGGLSSVAVGAISSTYVGSGVARKAAEAFMPGTEPQIIDAEQYLTGVQYIRGDEFLLPENIKSGVTIFDVAGEYKGSGGLPSGVSALASGVFQPTEDIKSNYAINHGLGVVPNFFLWWLEEDMSTTPVASLNIGGAIFGKNARYNATSTIVYTNHYFFRGYSTAPQITGTANSSTGTTYLNATSCRMMCSSSYLLKAGYTYHWVAGVVDGIE